MNITTEPIRDRRRVKEILAYLKGKNSRNYLMAKVQLNTGLRICDVLKFKVSHFMQPNFKFRESITLYEKKTKKEKKIALNNSIKESVKEFILMNDLCIDDYLFRSGKDPSKPITTTQAHRIYQDVANALHIDNFNSHSMRKTWGYFAYKETKNIALIMEVYNHNSEKQSLKYIGITQDDKNDLYLKIQF